MKKYCYLWIGEIECNLMWNKEVNGIIGGSLF